MIAISRALDTPEPTAAELIAARPHLAMHAMDGLVIDAVPLNAIADDVGTPVLGEGGNNPPSLRGVWDAAPYFSDGSARTIEAVIRRTDPGASAVHARENAARPPAFSAEERAALCAFLRAL